MKKSTCFVFLCLITAGYVFTGCNLKTSRNQNPVVTTTSGTVSGSIEDGVYSFKGIPYARAERFMPAGA